MTERAEHGTTNEMAGGDRSADVIVVGAGLAGLSAAVTAALEGRHTVLVEAHQLGGRAQSVQRDGFTFNLGAHALYRTGEGTATLRALGVTPQGRIPGATAWAMRGDQLGLLPVGAGSLLRSQVLGPRAKWAAAKLLARLPRLDAASLGDRTAADLLDEHRLPLPARQLVETMIRLTTYVADPAAVSADAAVRQLQLAAEGNVLYLHGGWQRLVDQMRERFEQLGGVTRTGTEVCSIRSAGDGDGVVVVDTRTGPVTARAVVLAVGGPANAAQLLGLDGAFVDRLGPQIDAACLALGLRRPPERRFVLALDRPLYLSTHSPVAELAPPGAAVVELLKYLDPARPASADDDRRELEQFAAATGLDTGDVVASRFLRRVMVMGGTPRADRGGLAGRPSVAVDAVPGAFLAGDWVGPDGLLADASLASGRAAGLAAATRAAQTERPVPVAS